MRVSSTVLAGTAALILWHRGRTTGGPDSVFAWKTALLAGLAGLLDTTGNLFYAMASLKGRLDVAAVLSSLYPAGTMLLALWLLKERAMRSQLAGMALALAAVALISV